MGKSRYNIVQELLNPIVGEKIHINKLYRRIMIEIGTDERTIKDYLYLMISLGLIKEVEPFIYEIISIKADI